MGYARRLQEDEPPVLLKHLGFDFDYYNPDTGKAGAIVFRKDAVYGNRVWTDFGHTDARSGKTQPQPVFLLPVKTKVYATINGVVVDIPKLYSGDYSIHIATSRRSRWRYELEHVVNPTVKVGDKVKAGQVIAEVGPDNGRDYGYLDVGILKGGNPPEHVCPFAYLDRSIKEETQKKITALYKAWENFKGDSNIYREETYVSPGCVVSGTVEG